MEESATASSDKDEDDEERKVEDENNDEEEEPTTEDEEKPEERDEDKEEMDEDKEEESLDEDKVQLDEEKDDKKEDEEHKETPGLSLLSCPRPSLTGMDDDDDDIEDEELEAFLQRNFSERRKSRWGLRRASSPFTAEGARRRLSTFTVSSGDDTAISIDEGEITEEEILENIRINKELIESIRYQPWRMKKKYKSLRQAKAYVKKHEGELMQSKKSGDIFAKYTIIFSRGWNKFKREVANLIVILTPWEMRIKKIESQFGSVVASYFIFLRWVFWVNFFITIFVCCFLMVPEVIRGIDDGSGMRKSVDGEEEGNALNLNAIWNFEGYLKYSPIFYGYYGCAEMTSEGYRLPLAYFLTSLCVYIFSFFVILRKMAENSRMSKLSEKDDECTFAWKLFTGWDYMIGNAETAYNKTASLVMGFKEAILEEKEKKKEDKSWKIITLRVIANFFVFILLTSSAYTIVLVVERSEEPEAKDDEGHWWRKHELQIVVGCIGTIFPNLFEMIGLMEKYHPRIQLRWQLARILVLNLLNLYTLIFSLFNRVLGMIKILDEIKRNITITSEDLATIDRMNISMSFQLPSLSSLSLIANQHLALDSVDADFQNCTFIIIQNCTIALLNQFRNGTTRTYETTDSTEGYNASFPYYNATDDISDGDEDMDSDYAAVIMRISNYTAHGVANWSFPGAVTHVHPPLYFSNGTAQFDTLYPDGIWELPINTSHLGFDDDNLTTTVRTTMYDRSKNLTTSTWLTPDEAATWILNNSETWNATEEPTTTTEQLNCTVRLCLPYSSTASPTDNLTADVTTTTRSDLTEGSTLDLNATDDITTAIATEGTDSAPATPTPTVCCGSRCSQPEYKAPPPKREDIPSTDDLKNSPGEIRANLKKNCWETMFGQELVKLTVSDIPMTIVMTLLTDFIRAVFVRYANQCWCWDLEKGFPGYGDFKIAENILHLVNNQGMIWMGMFFAPGLPAINTVKLCILLYFRSWVVLTCNIPHETVFKASGSNNFYFALLLIMLFLCTLPVGFAVVWLDPSWHCGPFSQYRRIYGVFTTYLENVFPSWLNKVMEYVTSPGVVIPLLLLLVLIIYYLLSLTGSLRESNNDLKLQLRREKSSGKPAKEGEEKSNEKGEETQNEANKWSSAKKILPVLPNKFRVSGNIPGEDDNDDDDDDKQTDSRSRRVQYSGDDEQTEEGPNGTDSPPTSETQASKNSTTQKSKRTPKPLLKSVENLRKEDTEDRRKSGRVTTGSIGSVDVPVITISQPSESKGKSKESLNSLEKMSPSPRRGKLTKKASEPVVTLTPSRNKKAKKKRGVSLEDVRSESDVGNGSDARAERSTDDTETSDAEGSVLNNQPARERRKRGEMTRYHSSRSHSSSLDTPPLIEEEEEEGRKSTLPIAATKAKLQRQQADTDSLGSNQRPKSTTDAESTSDERKEPLKENEDKKAKIQRLSTDSL